MNSDIDVITEYEIVKNMALNSGISSARISYLQERKDLLYLVVDCHKLLKLHMFYVREWTIDFYYFRGNTHNHIFDSNSDGFIKKLFDGDIFILIDKRFHMRLHFNFKFIDRDDIDRIYNGYKSKRNIMLFSAREILIDTYSK